MWNPASRPDVRARRGLAALALALLIGTHARPTAAAAASAVGTASRAHFVVLGRAGDETARVEQAVRDAGGAVLASWPQIGVVVASSADAGFATAVRGRPGVQGAGATRNLVELASPSVAAAVAAAAAAKAKSLERTESILSGAGAFAAGTIASDPLEANQWNLAVVRADLAHDVTAGSRDVVVGVLDTGIEATHPDLAANLDPSLSVGCTTEGVPDTSPGAWAPTAFDHGTHVAGIVAAARNGIGIVGVAPGVRLASVKVVDDDGFIYPEYAICGYLWAAEHGFAVTNASFYVDPWLLWCGSDPDQRASIEAVARAVRHAARRGVVNVASAGNANWDLAHAVVDRWSPNNGVATTRETGRDCIVLPAENRGALAVSSIGANLGKSPFSNYGRGVIDFAAPGGDRLQVPASPDANGLVLSTIVGGRWGYKAGTSMSAPHVAGVAALVRSIHPEWSANRVVAALRRDADRQPCPAVYDPFGTGTPLATCEGGSSGRGFHGSGLVDALDAVTR